MGKSRVNLKWLNLSEWLRDENSTITVGEAVVYAILFCAICVWAIIRVGPVGGDG